MHRRRGHAHLRKGTLSVLKYTGDKNGVSDIYSISVVGFNESIVLIWNLRCQHVVNEALDLDLDERALHLSKERVSQSFL
jgi:hypothetical protein